MSEVKSTESQRRMLRMLRNCEGFEDLPLTWQQHQWREKRRLQLTRRAIKPINQGYLSGICR